MMTVGSMVFETKNRGAYSRALRALQAGGATITYSGKEDGGAYRIVFTPCEGFDHVTRHPPTEEKERAYRSVLEQSKERGLPTAGGWKER